MSETLSVTSSETSGTTTHVRRAIRVLEGFLLGAGAFLALQQPFERTLRSRGHGIVAFERASADRGAEILNVWGGSDGLGAAAARQQLLLDYVFIVAYVGAIVAACWYVVACVRLHGFRLRRVAVAAMTLTGVAAVAAGVLDALENAVLFLALNGHHVSAAGLANAKFALVGSALVVSVVAFVATLLSVEVRGAWAQAHSGLRRRLLGLRTELPPIVIEPLTTGSDDQVAICCSGGGIRSASFNLGVLQRFMREDTQIYQKASVISAVSGGSYIASAIALTRTHSDPQALTPESPAFAPGSPEERHLRTHMRYLLPDKRVAGIGALALLFGLLTNLGVVLAATFVGARVLGWCLHTWSGPGGFTTATPDLNVADWVWWTCLGITGAGLLVHVVGEKVLPIYFAGVGGGAAETDQFPATAKESVRSWSLRLLSAGVVGTILLLGVPGAILGLNRLALDNQPTRLGAELISDLGFTTNRGCKASAEQAFRQARDAAILNASVQAVVPAAVSFEYGTCGQTFRDRSEVANPLEVPTNAGTFREKGTGPGSGFLATLLTLLALIKTTAGKVRAGATEPSKATSAVRGALAAVPAVLRRTVAPWLGSIIVVVLLLVFTLRVAEDAMLAGISYSTLWHLMLVVAALLALPFFTDATRTSLHTIYRERLSTVFAVRRTGAGTAEPVPYERPLLWSEMPPALTGDPGLAGPELIVCATVNVEDAGLTPPGRGGAPFAFSRSVIGIGASDSTLWAPALDYQVAAGPGMLTVPASIAMSGAAISPVMGRMTRRPVRLLLGLANVRLGVWLPNPTRVQQGTLPSSRSRPWWQRALAQWRAPGVTCVLREMVGRNSIRRRYVYVTDGGHYDNLGLIEALRRQPRLVYVIDGSGDTPPTWTTLGHAISLARADLGADIVLDNDPPTPENGVVPSNVLTGEVTYRDGTTGRLVIGKLVRTSTTAYDLDVYANDDPAFPNKSTSDQLFGDLEFESYRKFGQLTGELMAKAGGAQMVIDVASLEPAPARARRVRTQP